VAGESIRRFIDGAWPSLLALSAALLVLMQWIGPGGAIVDLELAWSPQRAMAVLAGFGDPAAARIQVAVDLVFIVTLSMGMMGAIRRVWPPALLRSAGTALVGIYAASDLLENAGLLLMLGFPVEGMVSRTTTAAAVLKFSALAAVAAVVAAGIVVRAGRERSTGRR